MEDISISGLFPLEYDTDASWPHTTNPASQIFGLRYYRYRSKGFWLADRADTHIKWVSDSPG